MRTMILRVSLMNNSKINIEELNDEEKWLLNTMVKQMDVLVDQMGIYPVYDVSYSNAWFNLKEKLGLDDL